jgi:hypothetical protein
MKLSEETTHWPDNVASLCVDGNIYYARRRDLKVAVPVGIWSTFLGT